MACSRPASGYSELISGAERIVEAYPDSALTLVETIDAADLGADSLRAGYHLVVAGAHASLRTSMASDSMIRFSCEYFKDRDDARYAKSAALYALYLTWIGEARKADALLDSLAVAREWPDSLIVEMLQTQVLIKGSLYDSEGSIPLLKRLLAIDADSTAHREYKQNLSYCYAFVNQPDSALLLTDELIDFAVANHLEDAHFIYTYDKLSELEIAGRYAECIELADWIMEKAPDNSAAPFVLYWNALACFNLGDHEAADRVLTHADRLIADADADMRNYYESFAGHLRDFIYYKKTGTVPLSQFAVTTNVRKNEVERINKIRLEAEHDALRNENRALLLKSKNERQAAVIIGVLLVAVIILLSSGLYIFKRRRRIMDAEERAETLQRMVDGMKAPATETSRQEALRRAMLQQLGFIKMVAEVPTEQNRDMLRKFSSLDGDTGGALVNWVNVYDAVDNLYSNFHTKLHDRYGDILTEKEIQIIVLMTADFSTKEISVITSQTTATIYVRKSSIRKKLGVPEKEDIVAFLNQRD